MNDPTKWYWVMDGSTTHVWSSESAGFVSVSDQDYQSWAKTHRAPIMSWSSLFDLMMRVKISAAAVIALNHQDTLTPSQISKGLIVGGCTIKSAATPSLDGTYAIGLSDIQRINIIAAGLTMRNGFPEGIETIAWFDINEKQHRFTHPDFLAFAGAIEDYFYHIMMTEAALNSGQTASWPTLPKKIP